MGQSNDHANMYHDIVYMDDALLEALATSAIAFAANSVGDLWNDEGGDLPTNEHVREFAAGFTKDLLHDFSLKLIEKINQKNIDATLPLRVEIKL